MIWIPLICLLIIIISLYQYGFILPSPNGLRVLLYHKVSNDKPDGLTVTTSQFEEHLSYIKSQNFECISMSDLLKYLQNKEPIPNNVFLITFDDGYVNNSELAYPVLKKFNMKATIFLPTEYIGDMSRWENDPSPLMSVEQLHLLDKNVFELALHSHTHENYKDLSAEEIESDVKDNIYFIKATGIEFVPVLAYPFGGRPLDNETSVKMKQILSTLNIKAAFRIGNRVNPLPLKDIYEIKRIDIRGTDSFSMFKRKFMKGRYKQL